MFIMSGSDKSLFLDLFELENMRRKPIEVIYSGYVHIYEGITSVYMKVDNILIVLITFLQTHDAFQYSINNTELNLSSVCHIG